ncbi:unnamed protein product [Durusdinium trenchii]|uniref:Uncharacterized protein n=1 Tax=Durusdinium trenchii TaxID=1381693 RepID=A0ABP0MCC1_9DINO
MNDVSLPPPPPPPPPEENGEAFDGNPFGSLVQPSPLVLRCKVVLLGDSAAGKTSLAKVFQGGAQSFPKNYNMTIGVDFLVKRVNIPETNVAVELYIVDCGGFSVCQDVLRPQWETANAMMLVYDVANPESFSHLEDWYAQLKYARGEPAISGVVIATKTDLMDRPGCISVEKIMPRRRSASCSRHGRRGPSVLQPERPRVIRDVLFKRNSGCAVPLLGRALLPEVRRAEGGAGESSLRA